MSAMVRFHPLDLLSGIRFLKHISEAVERAVLRHPYLAFGIVFVGMPVAILGAVALLAAAVMFPVALLMGWPL